MAPAAEKRRTMAAPMPLEPPVMKARRPSKERCSVIRSFSQKTRSPLFDDRRQTLMDVTATTKICNRAALFGHRRLDTQAYACPQQPLGRSQCEWCARSKLFGVGDCRNT